MLHHTHDTTVPFVLAALLTAQLALAQSQGLVGPSVLDLQKSYHVGIYSTTIAVPSGQLQLLSQHGTIDLAVGGAMSGVLDTFEWTAAGGTFTPNDPLAGTYHVAPDGIVEFDLDPANPGNELLQVFVDTDATTMHVARYELAEEALGLLAIEKSTGQSNATLNGVYHFYGQRMELVGLDMETTGEWGTATFDGAGGVSFVGTELFAASSGATSTSPITGSTTYTVASDGALVLSSQVGAVAGNGELFFTTLGSLSSSEVGLMIGVRQGANYDHNDIKALYSVHGVGHELGFGPGLPRTVTDVGAVTFSTTSPTAGTWSIDGITIDGNSQGQLQGSLAGNGSSLLASNGILTLTDPLGSIELAVSSSANYLVGRVIDNTTNLFFAQRACPESFDFGSGTAGTGNLEPELGMRTFPTIGNAAWRFAIIEGRGGAAAILPIGFAAATSGIPLSGGLLWLDPLAIAATPFVVLGGAAGVAGAGSVDLALPIPNDPSFAGVELFAQALVLDPAAPASVAMSRGLHVVFCR